MNKRNALLRPDFSDLLHQERKLLQVSGDRGLVHFAIEELLCDFGLGQSGKLAGFL